MSLDDDLAEGHEPHEKHLQLGTDLANDDRTPMTEAEKDAAWADATTVEQFKVDIEELAAGGG